MSGFSREEEEVNGVEAYDVKEGVKSENGGNRWSGRIEGGGRDFGLIDFGCELFSWSTIKDVT